MNTPPLTDLQRLHHLISTYNDAAQKMAARQSAIDESYSRLIAGNLEEFSLLQNTFVEAEAEIKKLALSNPSWFADVKTLTTPFGKVRETESRPIKAPSEDASIHLIRAAGRPDLLHIDTSLDKDALGKLSDDELAKFGLSRPIEKSIKISPAKVEMGKALEEKEKPAKPAKKSKTKEAA
jgi:hypothetical protein